MRRTVYLIGPDGVIRFGQRGMPDPDRSSVACCLTDVARFYPILDTEIAARHGVDPVARGRTDSRRRREDSPVPPQGIFLARRLRATASASPRLAATRARCLSSMTAPISPPSPAPRCIWGRTISRPPRPARWSAPQTLIGFSTHNERQLRAAAAEPADYLALGPIFGTSSKEQSGPRRWSRGTAPPAPLDGSSAGSHRRHHARATPKRFLPRAPTRSPSSAICSPEDGNRPRAHPGMGVPAHASTQNV